MGLTENMLSRLPYLYRDGELVAGMLAQTGVQLEILAEEALDVQRAHWFDSALDLDDPVRLAELFDIPCEPWQNLGEFRAWVHALRNARLRHGAVTRTGLQNFVAEYTQRYQQAAQTVVVTAITTWNDSWPSPDAAFVENPPRRFTQTLGPLAGIEPLQQMSIVQRGLDVAAAGFLLVGLPTAPESAPAIVNVSSGEALIFLGQVPPGERLWLSPQEDGTVQGFLEQEDVSDRLYSVSSVTPGIAWESAAATQPAQAISLLRGKNDLWFFPLAHYDVDGLDRFLLALPDLLLRQGRYDETDFDKALFYQQPAAILRAAWTETEPASFEIYIPGGTMLSPAGELEEALVERDRLEFSLNQAVNQLRAAGVAAGLHIAPFAETQGSRDYLTMVLPKRFTEVGPTGADRISDAAGMHDVTRFDDSTYA
jgi:hypothetical protein